MSLTTTNNFFIPIDRFYMKDQEGSLLNFLSYMGIKYNTEKLELKRNPKNGFIYIDITTTFLKDNHFNDIISLIKKYAYTNCKLIIWYPFEAFTYDYMPQIWDSLLDACTRYNFSLSRIYFVSGDVLNNDTTNKKYNEINRISCDLFEIVTKQRYVHCSWQAGNNFKDKLFLNLNYKPRAHRLMLYYYLLKNKLVDDNLVSMQSVDSPLSKEIIEEYNFEEKFAHKIELPERIISDDNINDYVGYQNKSWYDRTVFSLVSETHDHDYTIFPTEKVYKPIMLGHPFVIWGNPGMLKYLQTQGYQTFPELFDESYDSTLDKKIRLKKIIDICKTTEIKPWSQETQEKLDHNRNLLLSQNNTIKNVTNAVKCLFST